MTRTSYSAIHYVAASVGISCTLVECFSNVEHIFRQTGTLHDPAVAAALVTSIGVVIALSCSLVAFRQMHVINGTMLLCAFGLGAAFTLSTTLDRVASARDATLSAKWKADPQHQELVALHSKVSYLAARECGTGRGAKCDAIAQEVRIAEQRLEARRGELDSLGKRLAALVPGVTASGASLYQPMLLPLTLFLLGSWLTAFGVSGRQTVAEFHVKQVGRPALVERANRFAREFRAAHRRLPSAAEVEQALGVSTFVARGLLRDLQAA